MIIFKKERCQPFVDTIKLNYEKICIKLNFLRKGEIKCESISPANKK